MNLKFPNFARPWAVKLGKSRKVVRVFLPEQLADDARALSQALSINMSTLMRDLLLARVYGVEQAASMQSKALKEVVGMVAIDVGTKPKPEGEPESAAPEKAHEKV